MEAVLDNSDLNSKPFEFITNLNKTDLKLNSPKGNYRKCTRTVWRIYFVILGFEELNAHYTVDRHCWCIWRSFYFLSMRGRLKEGLQLWERKNLVILVILYVWEYQWIFDGFVTAWWNKCTNKFIMSAKHRRGQDRRQLEI